MEITTIETISMLSFLAAGIAMGMGAIGSAIGEGFVAMKAVEALGRQPQASGKILRIMVIGQAVTETASIFALVVGLMLIFKETPESAISAIKIYSNIGAGIAIGFGTIGAGLGAGLPAGSTMSGIAKHPENADALTIHMIIGQAVTQTSCIFALTISLILLITNPDASSITFTKQMALLGAGIAMGFGAIGPGIGDGLVAMNANKALAKDIKNMGLLTRTMIIGQAITETTDIYAMVVSLILIFVVT